MNKISEIRNILDMYNAKIIIALIYELMQRNIPCTF